MYREWSEAAEEAQDSIAEHWEEDWPAVLRGFRRTENALRSLNAMREEEGDEPLSTDEELEEFFRESVDWELQFVGEYASFTVRVWSYAPWDGMLAFAVASSEDGSLASPTSLA